MNIIIYGAQGIALGVCKALVNLNINNKILGFVVTRKEGNPNYLNGLPVVELGTLRSYFTINDWTNIQFLIATPENFHFDIEESLEINGFINYHRVTSVEYARLMEFYYAKIGHFLLLRSLLIGQRRPFVKCFIALSEVDKPLRNQARFESWMEPVQVGAAIGDRAIAVIRDNDGDNISSKNRNYSELTALYWLWKNHLQIDGGEHIYYGLMQYRRRLDISNDELMRLNPNEVDVVLPYPMIYEPNISVHPRRYLKDVDFQALLFALKEIHPAYAEKLSSVLSQPYFYNYNVILAKKSVMNNYCKWLFPILERVEELSEPKGENRADRYIGYMGELLETLYFMYHKDDLHIVHTGCKFLL